MADRKLSETIRSASAVNLKFSAELVNLGREDVDDAWRTERFRRYSLEEAYPNLFADAEAGRALLAEAWAEAGFSFAHGAYSQREMPIWDLSEALPGIPVRSLVLAGLLCIGIAALDETLQGLRDARSGSAGDVALDLAGAAGGAFFFLAIERRRRQRAHPA